MNRQRIHRLLAVHALTWLVLANLVGLWLATLLLAPRLGLALPAAGYGRWLPLHLDLQFYGWISLPLIGLLLAAYLPRRPGRLPGLAVGGWSAALAFSAASWLAGRTSGKTFLEWTGAARWAWGGALVLLAATIIRAYVLQRREQAAGEAPTDGRWQRAAKIATILALLPVPVALLLATSPQVYPPINPDSGGATATNTLGSVLGVIAILLVAPLLVGLKPTDGGRRARWAFALLALHFVVFGLLDHGDRSHHRLDQFLGLLSLVAWWPLGRWYLSCFQWPRATRPWRWALGAWSALLLASGVAATTPGVLELWKFTNVMVGHVHLALAGVATSLCVLVLMGLGRRFAPETSGPDPISMALGGLPLAALWNAGLLVHVAALTWLGTLEGGSPQILWSGDRAVTILYGARWLGGCAMALASVFWWLRSVPVARERQVELLAKAAGETPAVPAGYGVGWRGLPGVPQARNPMAKDDRPSPASAIWAICWERRHLAGSAPHLDWARSPGRPIATGDMPPLSAVAGAADAKAAGETPAVPAGSDADGSSWLPDRAVLADSSR